MKFDYDNDSSLLVSEPLLGLQFDFQAVYSVLMVEPADASADCCDLPR